MDNSSSSGEKLVFEVTLLSDGQERVCYISAMISATLSIIGSSTIVYKVLRNRSKATPYDRIMLGLSGCDIIGSFAYGMSPILPPSDTSERVWSIGTDATCSFLGFLTQFAFAAVMYNAMLSFYYLLTVRFNVKRQVFAKKYELWMHILCLTFGLGTATSGAAIGLYSELDIGYGCWVNDYPHGCEEADGPECTGQIYGMIFAAAPTLFAFLSLVINNCIIYVYVRRNLAGGGGGGGGKKSRLSQGNDNEPSVDGGSDGTSSRTSSSGPSGWKSNKTILALPVPHSPAYNDRVREVATQGVLYVGSFVIAFTPAFVWRSMDAFRTDTDFDESRVFPLLVLMSITLPLQGFMNMLVYNRPNYVRVRRAYPNYSTFAVIRHACLSSDIPRLTEIVSSHLACSTTKKGSSSNDKLAQQQQKNNSNLNTKSKQSNSSGGLSFWSNLDVLPEGSREQSLDVSSSNNSQEEEQSSTDQVLDEWSSSSCDYVVAVAAEQQDGGGNTLSTTTTTADDDDASFLLLYGATIQERRASDESRQQEGGNMPSNHMMTSNNDLSSSSGGFRRICMDGSLRRVDEDGEEVDTIG